MRPVKPESANRANSSLTLWLGMSRPIAEKGASVARSCLRRRAGNSRGRARRSPGSVMQDLREKLLRALGARFAEEILLQRVLDDLAEVHEDHAVSDLAREAHLVRDHHN